MREIGIRGEKTAIKTLNLLGYKNIDWISGRHPCAPYDIYAEKNNNTFIFDVKVRNDFLYLYDYQLEKQINIAERKGSILGIIFIDEKEKIIELIDYGKILKRKDIFIIKRNKKRRELNKIVEKKQAENPQSLILLAQRWGWSLISVIDLESQLKYNIKEGSILDIGKMKVLPPKNKKS